MSEEPDLSAKSWAEFETVGSVFVRLLDTRDLDKNLLL